MNLQACLLLSLENIYPPAHQLALDMLHRISNATEEITEVLLSKNQVIAALRYAFCLCFKRYLWVSKLFFQVYNMAIYLFSRQIQ